MTELDQGLSAYRQMALIRDFESRLPRFAEEGLIQGSTHPSVGMEASAVGVSAHLRSGDTVASNHRGHAHCLAKGADPKRVLAEILGRVDGYCQGRGGSMHIDDKQLGILGTNGVVGAGIGLATGAALRHQYLGGHEVSVTFFGDGAINQGIFSESLNLAAIWSLPAIFICENNGYAQSSRLSDMVTDTNLTNRARALGVEASRVDGMHYWSVSEAARRAVEKARKGDGPSFIQVDTYRFLGHMAGDTEIYRDRDEVEKWQERDPLRILEDDLISRLGVKEETLRSIDEEVMRQIDEAEVFARESELPDAHDLRAQVFAIGQRGGADA